MLLIYIIAAVEQKSLEIAEIVDGMLVQALGALMVNADYNEIITLAGQDYARA